MTIIESEREFYDMQRENAVCVSSFNDLIDHDNYAVEKRKYVTNFNLTRNVVNPLLHTRYTEIVHLTNKAIAISEKLIIIPGIINIAFKNNCIVVFKVESFHWDMIHNMIIEAIENDVFSFNYTIGDLTEISFVYNRDLSRFIIATKIRLVKFPIRNESFLYSSTNFINWREYRFENLTRKGKIFVSLLKELLPYDFFRLTFSDYRLTYQILNFNSYSEKEQNAIHQELLTIVKMILQRIQIGIST